MSEREAGRRTRLIASVGPHPARARGARVAWVAALLSLAPSARADASPTVQIDCADLDQDARAALEARALGILLVNGGLGELSLACNGGLALAAWRSDSGQLKTLGEPRAAQADALAARETTIEQLVDLAARLLPAPADTGAAAGASAAQDVPALAQSPAEDSAAREAPPAPLASPFDAFSERPQPTPPPSEAVAPAETFPALRVGAAAEIWDGRMCCTAGFVLGAAVPLSGALRLGTSGSFELGVSEVSGVSVRHARFGLDLELQNASWLAVSGGAYVSALWVEATNVVTPETVMSVQPVLALQTFARLPAGPHELAAGPVLRAYAKERELRVDGALVARQPAFTVGLTVELRIRL